MQENCRRLYNFVDKESGGTYAELYERLHHTRRDTPAPPSHYRTARRAHKSLRSAARGWRPGCAAEPRMMEIDGRDPRLTTLSPTKSYIISTFGFEDTA